MFVPSTFGFTLWLQGALTVVIIVLAVLFHKSRRPKNAPPCCSGTIPWLGCAISFGKHPLEFIEKKRKQLGPIFSLYVAGERMTFLTKPEHFSYFFDESLVDFQLAVQDVVMKIASLDKSSFFTYHTKVHDVVRGKLASAKLNGLEENLCYQFNVHLNNYVTPDVRHDLMETVRYSMYRGVINNLFGPEHEFLQIKDEDDFHMFVDKFLDFDRQFERGARLPSIFLPKWTGAKYFLMNLVKPITSKIVKEGLKSENKRTLLEEYISVLDEKCATNYAVLLLWASLANAIPFTFWTLTNILGNKDIEKRLRKELNDTFGHQVEDSIINITQEDLRKVPYLKCCVMEAIRIQSVGVLTRRVTKDFEIQDYTIDKGTMLMVSPYWANRDENLFENPDVFMPERWENKKATLDGFIGFGGGRYRCPGRWFALMEIELFVALFLLKFDTTIRSPVPKADLSHVVGTQQPLTPFFVTCTQRNRTGNHSNSGSELQLGDETLD